MTTRIACCFWGGKTRGIPQCFSLVGHTKERELPRREEGEKGQKKGSMNREKGKSRGKCMDEPLHTVGKKGKVPGNSKCKEDGGNMKDEETE